MGGSTGSGEAIAGVVIAIGVLLVIAAFRGGARWLIFPALALALPLSAVAAADVSFDGGVGERSYEPISAEAIPEDGYELGVGRLAVDLRQIDWNANSVVELSTDLGVGQTAIAVPENVCVTGDLARRRRPRRGRGDEEDGFDVDTQPADGTNATPRLALDSEVDLGHLWIVNDDDLDIEDDLDRGAVPASRRRRRRGHAGRDDGGVRAGGSRNVPAREGK